jgi:hypothetical protein
MEQKFTTIEEHRFLSELLHYEINQFLTIRLNVESFFVRDHVSVDN